MKRFRHIVLSIALLFSTAAPMAVSAGTAIAQTGKDAICDGVRTSSGGTTSCVGNDAGNQLSGVIRAALRVFQAVIGVISLFVLSIAGLGYITSGGDSGKTKTAKDRILYAAIGLVVVGLAQVIISFVLNRVDSANTPAFILVP